MSMYTTELRFICESLAGGEKSSGYSQISEIIKQARPKIFDFEYPIFDESYREILETKIIRHYYVCEIGMETFGLWKLYLESTMNEIMPYYNQLYESAKIDFNPIYNVDYTITHKGTGSSARTDNDNTTTKNITENTSTHDFTDKTVIDEDTTNTDLRTRNLTTAETTENTGSNTRKNLYSDTPQNGLSDVQNGNYLTNATYETNGSTADSTRNVTEGGTDQHEITVTNDATTTKTSKDTITGNTENNGTNTRAFTSNENTTDDYIRSVTGWQGGSYSDEILKYRNTLLNIDVMIINELKTLFFGLWN